MKKAYLVLLFWGLTALAGYAATADDDYSLGITDYQAGKWNEAISYFESAVQLNPDYWQAYQLLGYAYYEVNNLKQAVQDSETSLNLNPNNPTLETFLNKLKALNPAAVASHDTSKDSEGSFELNVNGGLVVAGNSGLASSFATGAGGGLSGYFPVDKHLSIGAITGFYAFSQNEAVTESINFGPPTGTIVETTNSIETTNSVEAMVAAKYHFDGNGIKPYVFAGAGISYLVMTGNETAGETGYSPETITTSIPNQIDPMFAVGLGLDFQAGDGLNLFVQGKESVILMPAATTTYTTSDEVETETVGGALTYSAFEGGLSFDVQ